MKVQLTASLQKIMFKFFFLQSSVYWDTMSSCSVPKYTGTSCLQLQQSSIYWYTFSVVAVVLCILGHRVYSSSSPLYTGTPCLQLQQSSAYWNTFLVVAVVLCILGHLFCRCSSHRYTGTPCLIAVVLPTLSYLATNEQ